jgi:hypothetical protein
MPMSDKSQEYWEGFADGQADMESQHAEPADSINPNEFVHSLDLFAGWLLALLENNGSEEIGENGAPMFADYGQATQAMLATAFAYTRLLRITSACIFKLNQGDFTEEHFHHELAHAFNKLENENPFHPDDDED